MQILLTRVIFSFSLLAIPALASNSETDSYQTRGQQIVSTYQKALGSKLKSAMKEGGPEQAISVCHTQAPLIAEKLGREQHVTLKRVSNKPRNPAAAPDDTDTLVLSTLAAALNSAPQASLEKTIKLEDGSYRYYQAITIQPVCLTCHGQTPAPAIQTLLKKHYPSDQATGYALGDLRGAFVVSF